MPVGSPSVSVVVPLYDMASSVRASVASALAQTYSDFELIVVDDGSRDGGGAIVESMGDPRVRVLRQENAGVSAARNAGIIASRAPWVALLDADDRWEHRHLEQLIAAAGSAAVVGAFSNSFRESQPGRPSVPAACPAGLVEDYFAFALANGGYPIATTSVMLRRSNAVAAGLFPPGKRMGEDTDMWCRLACRGPFFYNAALSATYSDLPSDTGVTRNLKHKAEFPPFAERLPAMLARGEVPLRLRRSARRYANFLLLEYARQLLDRDEAAEARRVLMTHCSPLADPLRFARRFVRTMPGGGAVYRAFRGREAGLGSVLDKDSRRA